MEEICRMRAAFACFVLLLIVSSTEIVAQDAPAQNTLKIRDRFRRFDDNNDGKLTPAELPRPKLFQRLDRNSDGLVTLAEALGERASASSPDTANTDLLRQRDVPYGEHPAQQLDVYAAQNVKHAPVMVYIHGGGWTKGDKSVVRLKAKHFIGAGWILVSINYRLLPEGAHPKNVEDVALALAWVHDHIAEQGGDPAAIFLMGHSAGCHLAALVATDGRRLRKAGKSLAMLKGVVALDTQAYDVSERVKATSNSSLYATVFGKDEEQQRDASPIRHIAADNKIPPFLICYSSGMTARVNPRRAVSANAFAAALRKAGTCADVVDASDRTHGQINQRFGDPHDEKVTGRAMAFLNALRTLQPKPVRRTGE